jgi:hypothetical protein
LARFGKNHDKSKTYQRYSGITEKFLDWLGPKSQLSLQHIPSTDIARFRDHLARKHSPASVNLSLGAIQAALSRAFRDRLVDVNEPARVERLEELQFRGLIRISTLPRCERLSKNGSDHQPGSRLICLILPN